MITLYSNRISNWKEPRRIIRYNYNSLLITSPLKINRRIKSILQIFLELWEA